MSAATERRRGEPDSLRRGDELVFEQDGTLVHWGCRKRTMTEGSTVMEKRTIEKTVDDDRMRAAAGRILERQREAERRARAEYDRPLVFTGSATPHA